MRLDVFTLFPEAFDWFQSQRSVQNALSLGSELRLFDYRKTTPLKAGQVDDAPYGGGAGMVLRVDVVDAALEAAYGENGKPRIVLLSPTGRLLDDELADELTAEPHLTLLCGRYEGFDDRIPQGLRARELSIGDYVLTGGEVPALVVLDAVVRLIPGVLGDETSAQTDSFATGLLEHPQYTRPPVFRGMAVPPVLLSGDHQAIARWRRKQAILRTRDRRPDLLEKATLSEVDRELLAELDEEEETGSTGD